MNTSMVSNNIKAERNRNNLSQEEVANMLGISRKTYGEYEKDARTLNTDIIIRLANIYKCNPSAFFIQDKHTLCE